MKTKTFVSGLLVTLLASPTVWASCSIDLDMSSYKITNVTMTNIDEPSEVASKKYADYILQGNAGLMASSQVTIDLNINESRKYCADLESPAYNDQGEVVTDIIYTDWYLPSVEQLVGLCLKQGTTITYDHVKLLEPGLNGEDEDRELLYNGNEYTGWDAKGICNEGLTRFADVSSSKYYYTTANNIHDVYDGYDLLLRSKHQPRYIDTTKYPVLKPLVLSTGILKTHSFPAVVPGKYQYTICVR